MAYGCELVLGFEYKDLDLVEKNLGIKLLNLPAIDEVLKKVHRAALERMGFRYIGTRDGYSTYDTPMGRREFVPFSFEVFYDPGEMGERPEDAVFGIAISGRYFPTFADWRDPHGSLANIVCDPEQREWMIAKEEICRAIPWMEQAKWIVKQKWY